VASVVTRCALVAIALLAGTWLVLGVRALDLEAEATTVRPGAQGGSLTPAEVSRALSSLRSARLLSVDKGPLLNEGLLLFATGRREEGLAIAERVVDEEPDNLDGWFALYTLYSASRDPNRAAQARRRVRALNPLAGDVLSSVRP
jgi:tetratricopeptide (TPR) repeat protein